jgi:hypothetical protein
MISILPKQNIVTLNLFQGLSILSSSGLAARWMLKQVQHDEVLFGDIRS